MAFTHDFEIDTDNINIQGEITFNHGQKAEFKTTTTEDMTVEQHGRLQDFLEHLTKFYMKYGEINKLEIIKKP